MDNSPGPAENMLGREGEGFRVAESWLVNGRVPYAAGTIGVASAALKIATEYAKDRSIQVLGGMGVSKEMPLERWYRELRIKRIGEGPSQVHPLVVARHLLRGAARDS